MWFRKKTNTPFQPMEFGDYVLKQATKNDWQLFRAFYLRALKERPTCSWESYDEAKRVSPEQWVARLESAQADPRTMIAMIVHKPSRELVGFAHIQGTNDANIAHQAWLRAFYIVPEYNDPKLATFFLQTLFKHMMQFSDVRKINAPVVADDRTQILIFNELGFTRYGFDESYYRIGGKYKDAILMLKRL